MKRKLLVIILCLAGMAVFAQDQEQEQAQPQPQPQPQGQSANMSFFLRDYTMPESTFLQRLGILEEVRNAGLTGIGEFYHEALRFFLLRASDIRTLEDRRAAEASARILAHGLGAEQYHPAAPDLWRLVVLFDVIRDVNQGLEMQDALVALGQVGGIEFLPQIIQRLDDFNTHPLADVETRRRVQRGVVGCIMALEIFQDPAGFRPVFFVSIGGYDPSIKAMASVALPNLVEDPGEIISGIIQNTSNNPTIKYQAFQEMLRTNAPDESKARVAATALATGWTFSTSNTVQQLDLREMRKSAIDAIRVYGVADDSIYANLRRSYVNNFNSAAPDLIEIDKTLRTLGAIGSEEAVELLLEFIRELHTRRRTGPWRIDRERQIFELALLSLGATGTDSMDVRILLNVIRGSGDYTGVEQSWAANAIRALGF